MHSDTVLIAQALERLNQALEELPANAREIFLLHRIEALNLEEIARRLNLDCAEIEFELARTLAHLERQLFHK